MRILALVSSYRKRGNTARIVEMIEARLEALAPRHGEALEFERLYPGHLDIQMCRGCWTWFDPGRSFYIDHRASPLKVKLARLTGRAMSRSVT